ncbi:MAG: tetratricopeptide repeat protein [Acidobacteria bacterium]|nr:tetratricopeptide repeat protein [Acidobacteriota bacterium]
MNTRSVLLPALALGVSFSAAACGQYSMGNLKARKVFKDANALYKQSEFKRAADKYEETIQANPDLVTAYFFLGNSYDNLYKPGRQGEPENDAYLHKAIENYKIAAERETDPKMKKLSLEYLVAAYGPDKLNQPEQAEPLVQRMVQMDPNEPTNYFGLAKIYEDAGRYDEAEAALLKARDVRPNDPSVYMQLAGYYNRQGEFPKTIDALEQRAAREPSNPEAYQLIGTYYWEKAFRDFRLNEAQKKEYILKGIQALDKALELRPEYMEALTYKNILLRMQANYEKDRTRQAALIKQADELRSKAMELQKKKTAGVGD